MWVTPKRTDCDLYWVHTDLYWAHADLYWAHTDLYCAHTVICTENTLICTEHALWSVLSTLWSILSTLWSVLSTHWSVLSTHWSVVSTHCDLYLCLPYIQINAERSVDEVYQDVRRVFRLLLTPKRHYHNVVFVLGEYEHRYIYLNGVSSSPGYVCMY